MAREILVLKNPYGMKEKGHKIVCVKGGERTHIYDKRTKAALCGAGRTHDGKVIKGAILAANRCKPALAQKIRNHEIDCLRCIKIIKLDPSLTGKPTTVEYKGGKPFVSRTPGLVVRQFRSTGIEGKKRKEHVMVAGGRLGKHIAKRAPAELRREREEMMRLLDRRGYEMDELDGEYGPHNVQGDLHNFRVGYTAKRKISEGKHEGKSTWEGHPTQTATARYPWFSRDVPGVVPMPGRRFPGIIERTNPKRDEFGRFIAKKKNGKKR